MSSLCMEIMFIEIWCLCIPVTSEQLNVLIRKYKVTQRKFFFICNDTQIVKSGTTYNLRHDSSIVYSKNTYELWRSVYRTESPNY
uniref:Putative secreted protein n=1 Tax=Ixodes ricinus TaxID=34613 RepID=A0A6B0U0L9_IXORI